ncbi:hypothetical protein [Aeoliella mucimassa]|uniref:Uncharacterized protein n=1 Tax=Aeoliella mucimassa TaxID=2527972 RepID=A0A518AK03_9BACT|nr:hypothetical protein [Aeoliella mucimassa]QDU55061.1 hypothetical protein Pan181_12470 [Aeoliella mucimassa]
MNTLATTTAACLLALTFATTSATAATVATPSLAADTQVAFVIQNFGTVRRGAEIAPAPYQVYNLDTGETSISLMSLVEVTSIGNFDTLIIDVPEIAALAPGESTDVTMSLDTSVSGFYQVNYNLQFTSDELPEAEPRYLALAGFATVLPDGDYTEDGIVDFDDYNLWKSSLGTADAAADGNMDGIVDLADYTIWRDNLGAEVVTITAQQGATSPSAATAAVPESKAMWLMSLAMLFVLGSKTYLLRHRSVG